MLTRVQQLIELCYEIEGKFLGGCCEFWGGRSRVAALFISKGVVIIFLCVVGVG